MGDTAVVQRYMTRRCKKSQPAASHSQLQKAQRHSPPQRGAKKAAAGGVKAAAAAAVLQR